MLSQPILITVEDMAVKLSIGRTAAWQLVYKNKIKSVKIGKSRRVLLTAIDDYVKHLLDEEAA
jgi:excisionase family DNA binding protein